MKTAKDKPPPNQKTVLLVESEDALRMLAVNALAREGYRVIVARDGKQALQTAAQHDCEIDLLVADVILPGFYGWHLAELLKLDYPQLKVIYLASFEDRDINELDWEGRVILLQDASWADALVAAARDVLASSVLEILSLKQSARNFL